MAEGVFRKDYSVRINREKPYKNQKDLDPPKDLYACI